MTEDERREQARALIAEAFAERPLKLIEGEVVEADAAETLATEREVMGESMGCAEVQKLTHWKARTNSCSEADVVSVSLTIMGLGMAQGKASRPPVHGKRVPLLIMIVHPKPMGKLASSSRTRAAKTPAKSKR